MRKIIAVSIVLLLLSVATKAQVSSFNRQVQIQSQSRNVSVSIPSSYTTGNPLPLLISLHGFGMTANGLETYLRTFTQQKQVIIANIDGAGNRHDDQLNGQEINVILSTLDSMKKWYSIDTNQVNLFGFSYGGRDALYFGSMYPHIFSGIITHSAAIQSTADVNNQFAVPWPNPFQYQNMSQIPSCNCMGNNDQGFGPFILQFQQRLGLFSSNDTLIRKNGVGHNIFYSGFFNDLQNCWDFIQRQNQVTTSVKKVTKKEVSPFYPNPSSGKLYTKSNQTKVHALRDMRGRPVSFSFQKNCLTIEGAPGLHLILYEEKGELKTQKIMIK